MDELWKFKIATRQWKKQNKQTAKRVAWPAPRSLHSAVVVSNRMLVYGGNAPGLGDVWSFDFVQRSWLLLAEVILFVGFSPTKFLAGDGAKCGEHVRVTV